MVKKDRVQNIILIIMFICVITLTVAYAILTQNLDINGVASVKKSEWNIHFTNVLSPQASGQATGGNTILNEKKTVLTITDGTFLAPGDKIVYTFDVINEGDLPAEVETTLSNIGECTSIDNVDISNYCNKISLELVYADTNDSVEQGDELLAKESKTLKLIITYDKNKELTTLPNSEINLSNITTEINYAMLQNGESSKKADLLSELKSSDYITDGMTVTTRDNYISLYSPYGSDGIVILKKEYNPKKYTKMIIKGKRIDGDSSYYHFFPGYTTTLSSWGSNLKTFFPSYGESFEYTVDLNLSDSITSIYPRIQYCVGTIDIYEWYLEKN